MSARPGVFIDLVETGWPRERDSRIVAEPRFGRVTGRIWAALRDESIKAMRGRRGGTVTPRRLDPPRRRRRRGRALLEAPAGSAWSSRHAVIPPSEMARGAWRMRSAARRTRGHAA